MNRIYWDIRAWLWGFFHPFATQQQHIRRAVWAAMKELP